MSSTDLNGIDAELAEVESTLEAPRRGAGLASFNSVRDVLGSIRNRVQSAQDRMDPSQRSLLRRISGRLETAELAHSERIPLGLLRGSSNRLMASRRNSRASLLSSRALDQSKTELSVEDDAEEKPSRRIRQSVLVASRVRADEAQGFEVEVDIQQGSMSILSPVHEGSRTSSMSDSEREESAEFHTVATETPILLTKRQSSLVRSGSLSGSLQFADKSGSVVYSWGSGPQSLHDDDKERTVQEAKLSDASRIGRPGAPAVLSVATSSGHSACATAQGDVLTCGVNREGAVDPNRRDESIIKKPTILEFGQTRVLQVSCGLDHTAALSGNGSVLTWGSNVHGQLGHRKPFRQTDASTTYCRPKAMILGGANCAAAVACGHSFTIVLTTRMSVVVCGVEAIAGYCAEGTADLPRPVPALEGLPVVSVAAGHEHATVLTAHGTAFAWGINSSGCCGRPYPARLSLPVPIHTPDTRRTPSSNERPFPNWASWDGGHVSLADDVAIIHAACGDEHTVMVTRSGRLLVCGNNQQGQLGLSIQPSISPVQAVKHPGGRMFVSAEAGESQTILLDDASDVWQMGHGKGLELVLPGKRILTIAAGGQECIAVAAGGGSARPQFSVVPDPTQVDRGTIASTLEELTDELSEEEELSTLSSVGQELGNRLEALLRCPGVLNSLFLDPFELESVHEHIVSVGNTKTRQAVATAIEKGITKGLERLRSAEARLIYPEAVRCLLLYITFSGFKSEPDVVYDPLGSTLSLLCETILGLPFEGYKAFLTWATSLYPTSLFVSMLIQPLLSQLQRALNVDIDDDGVEHTPLSRRSVPGIVALLRWLNKASERQGGIAPPESFYCDALNDMPLETLYEDLARYKKASKQEKAARFYLCANHFIMSTGLKRDLIQIEAQVEMAKIATREIKYDAESGEYTVNPFFVLEIEREHLMEQTLEKIKQITSPTELRKKLRVSFKGEEGVDAGGVTKEFFQLLSEELFDPKSSLWSNRYGDDITWFNSDCTWDDEGYELVGVLVGLAFYNGVLLDVRFPTAVYRMLLSLPLGLEDMVDLELKRSLQQLLDYEGDDVEDVFCLDFEVTWMDLGREQSVELKPGGADIPVTSSNKEEYVLLYVKWLLVESIHPQWDSFERGLMRVMEGASLSLFRPEELKLVLVGTPELDFEALEANTEYEGGYDENSGVVKNFWKFVKNAPEETQIKFLKFATGSSMAPIGGLGEMEFKIQRAGADSPQLPTSHTCFNTLLLPDYGENYEKLSRLLGRAVLECEGFGLQ